MAAEILLLLRKMLLLLIKILRLLRQILLLLKKIALLLLMGMGMRSQEASGASSMGSTWGSADPV